MHVCRLVIYYESPGSHYWIILSVSPVLCLELDSCGTLETVCCLWGIKGGEGGCIGLILPRVFCYHLVNLVRNDEVRRTTGQPSLSAIVQARRLSLFGHIARMPDETDARSIITASPSEDWRKPPGRPRTMCMKTIQQDLRPNNLSLDEAITVAQNRPFWRLMSAFGATHP